MHKNYANAMQVSSKLENGGSLIRQVANSLFDVFIYLFILGFTA